MMRSIFSLAITIFLITTSCLGQYLHRDGKKILDGNNQEIILRGMGLGGWMLQEPYMLDMGGVANTQYQIKAKVKDLIGEENTKKFYDAWLANHVTKTDIDSMASWGFNSVRLPMHYNLYTLPIEEETVSGQQTWLEKGFVMTDSLLKWCAANEIYLILDLHAAPGGQGNDIAISDRDESKPSLWQDERNKTKTIALWRKLAERYANEKWIGGYDLINETNWNFTGSNKNGCDETTNAPLKALMVAITNAIREVDNHHLIFIEGNCWANNHRGLTPLWDDNTALSFHKYWNYNDKASIQGLLDLQNANNVPLWLGESGENSNVWFRNAIRLMEDNKIGWAWWPLKKIGSVVDPLTVMRTTEYDNLLNYWRNGGTKPSQESATSALMQITENLKIKNNVYNKDVIDAMFRQVQTDETIPFTTHTIPGVVHASDYDLGRSQHAYFDSDTADYHVTTGSQGTWNSGSVYRNDGVDIGKQLDSDPDANGYSVGWTTDGEWLQYTVQSDSSAAYNISMRYSGTGKAKISVNGVDRSPIISLTKSTTMSNATFNDVIIGKGKQVIRVHFVKGGLNLGFLKFTLSKKTTDVGFNVLSGETLLNGTDIRLAFTKDYDAATMSKTGFSATISGQATNIASVTSDAQNSIIIKLENSFSDSDVIKVSYNSDAIKSADGTSLAAFADFEVANTLPVHVMLPATIEAENFVVNQGLVPETCTDTGGGSDLGYTNAGDYLEYLIKVPNSGTYGIEARVASGGSAGKLEFQQRNKTTGIVVSSTTLDIPVTGGWQTWQSVTGTIHLEQGTYALRVRVVQPEYNMNWFKFTVQLIDGIDKKKVDTISIYPNPANNSLKIELPEGAYKKENIVYIRQSDGKVVRKLSHLTADDMKNISIDGLPNGIYVMELESNGVRTVSKFVIQ